MQISVIGSGYVGLVTGSCFAEMGNSVVCVDINEKKIAALRKGNVSIYEPGLEELVRKNLVKENLLFTSDIESALQKSDICFITVGTPMDEDGSVDLQYIITVAKEIGKYMLHHMYIVNKSTVPVGTANLMRKIIQDELDERHSNLTFDVISNPEFLKEGTACNDFLKPDRIVIGADNTKAVKIMRELYTPYIRSHELFIVMDIESAELTKYAANAMLATKISFINEIANICERIGADINKVRIGIGSDNRIGYDFIHPGCGYGGSCFPKDIQALIKTSEDSGYIPQLLSAVKCVNENQKHVLVGKIISAFSGELAGRCFAIWGLAFKPETDDMRESSAITIINELIKRGAMVKAYDPKAMEQAKSYYLKNISEVKYVNSKYDALDDADALVIVTEWKEFRSPDFTEISKRLKGKFIFDGRNQYKEKTVKNFGLEYHQIGVAK